MGRRAGRAASEGAGAVRVHWSECLAIAVMVAAVVFIGFCAYEVFASYSSDPCMC